MYPQGLSGVSLFLNKKKKQNRLIPSSTHNVYTAPSYKCNLLVITQKMMEKYPDFYTTPFHLKKIKRPPKKKMLDTQPYTKEKQFKAIFIHHNLYKIFRNQFFFVLSRISNISIDQNFELEIKWDSLFDRFISSPFSSATMWTHLSLSIPLYYMSFGLNSQNEEEQHIKIV